MEIDWKKKYNEALEKIKRYTTDKYGCTRLKPADIFPELSNDDERMKKAIIDALNSHNNSINLLSSRGYSMDDVISYLEKKEQKFGEWNVEDERIRNEILEYFIITRARDFVANPERRKWISYIEKQKESGICWYKSDNKNNPKKPYIDKAGMFYTTDGRMCYASEIENQKEQTEELSTRLNGLMQEYVKSGKDEEEQEHRLKCYHLFWDVLGDSEFFKHKEQKSEWSDEDERMLSRCIKSVECSKQFAETQTFKKAKDKEKDWLKSLPERLNLQPKNEWSDEDELMRTAVIQTLETFKGRGTTEMQIKWLKSLYQYPSEFASSFIEYLDSNRPNGKMCLSNGECKNIEDAFRKKDWAMLFRYAKKYGVIEAWKPSEEQMKALKNSAYGTYQNSDGPVLRELYEQIKKLQCDVTNKFEKIENNHQQKQEWSEEDKEILRAFKFICKKLIENPSGEKFSVDPPYAEKMLKFLESLSPDLKQEPTCSWKPSKEQMGFLNGLLTTYMTVGQKQALKSLIGDLKKL